MSAVVEHVPQQQSLLAKFGARFGIEANKMLTTLKDTAFRQRGGEQVTNEQMVALLVVADQHGLNPFTKEIYAYPDKGAIVPVVGIDGWLRIINEHPQFDGMTLTFEDDSCTCTIYRKDRAHPTIVTEFISECRRDTDPWRKMPKRMIRNRAIAQAGRVAFGFSLKDPDEAEAIVMGPVDVVSQSAPIADINARIAKRGQATDIHASDPQPAAEDGTPQPPADEAPAADSGAPVVTFAAVASALNKAKSPDVLELAGDLIGSIADEQQRTELVDLYNERKAKLA